MKLFHNAARLITAPTLEPITLAFAKQHLVVQHTLHDDLITLYIAAARREAEKLSGEKFLTQTWEFDFSRFPHSRAPLEIPIRPIQSLSSILYLDTVGDSQSYGTLSGSPLTPEEYSLQRDDNNSRIVLKINEEWPQTAPVENAVTIQVVAGAGDAASDVSELMKAGMLLLIGHFYENRETVVVADSGVALEIPMGIRDLLAVPKVG